MTADRIVTPCPSCGSRTVFVGSGGHLTCSVIGCKEPSIEMAIARLQGEAEAYRWLEQRGTEAHAYCDQWLMPGAWGRHVWHAVLDDALRLRRGLTQLLGAKP